MTQVESSRADVIENLGKLAALGAVFLPVAGYIVRLAALFFGPAGTDAAYGLALKTTLPDLVVTGTMGILPVVGALLLLGRIEQLPAPPRQGFWRWPIRILALALGIVALVLGPFVLVWLASGAAFLSDRLFRTAVRRAGRVVFIEVWPRVALFMVYGALVSGIAGLLPTLTADDYHFAPQVAALIPNGRYVEMGENSQTIYLEDCGAHRIFAVDRSSLSLREVRKGAMSFGRSLLNIVLERKLPVVGFIPSC